MQTVHEKNTLNYKFSQYLVENEIIDSETALLALDLQQEKTPPVGKVAFKEKLLTVQQIHQVLCHQVDSNKMFGEIAIELGYLTQEAMDTILLKQQELRPSIGDILIDMRIIDKDTLYVAMNEFTSKSIPLED